ncbi:hypothetical protein [Lutispora thermophila]|uniref:Uncharacterized protein n=1 Tax=Lutispora thermophila DSM 19022 TaxID=1122184 RepID=A0A1M6GQH3_9FIRM|nr:hypothetical protein [Lutispora thermophila]SHJ12173.1 hypothetical protein SAMN02745176_02480 [Lutispora thermophila DSM 19022]
MRYIKVIRMSGSYFAREFEKNEKSKKAIKIREVDEETAAEQFIYGEATIKVIFEDLDREPIELSNESDEELIRRYLGTKFLSK